MTAIRTMLSIPDSGRLPAPPSLAAIGSRAIQPILRALLRAKVDAITGIIRADSASVKSIRLSRLAQSSFSDDSQRWPRGEIAYVTAA
jgi:hypothetical protein